MHSRQGFASSRTQLASMRWLLQNLLLINRHEPAAMNPEDLQLLLVREMPSGKYKGRVIADLPGNYLNWFACEGFPKGEIGRLLALMHEIDHNGLTSLLDPLRTRK
jgi:uncharacterized protein